MEKKVIAYSLLAHINNQSSEHSNYDNIFIPLVKRGLSKMCANGQFKGDDFADIKRHIDDLYDLNMPDTILKKMLSKIEREINKSEKILLKFYGDGSFNINEYVFDEYEEEVSKRNEELDRLQRIFDDFLIAEGKSKGSESIFAFVEQNKTSLGKYINKKYPSDHIDNTTEARFVNFIKPINELYNTLQSVYMGAIISTYLEYQPSGIQKDVELVLDTNFVISLIDLNTVSSTSNCQRLLEMASKLGYKFTVLSITIREIDQLLKTRVDYFDSAFLIKQVDPEDIYNACERRNLSKTDLDQIRNNITSEIEKFNVLIIPNTERYENKAKFSNEFEKLKEKRNTSFAALHDATCIEYVKEKRGKPIYEYDRVNCWFVNNSSSRSTYYSNGTQPYLIKAEDLLNLLWLASPMVQVGISNNEFSNIGLSRLVSSTLDDSLPNALTIRKLDDNIQKYAKGNVSDDDVVRVSKGIAARTITNLDNLNELAEKDNKKFIETLQEVADTQKKKEEDLHELLNKLIHGISEKTKILDNKSLTIDQEREKNAQNIEKEKGKYTEAVNTNSELLEQNIKIKAELVKVQNQQRKVLREIFIKQKIRKWRMKYFLLVLVGPIIIIIVLIYVLYLNNWNWELSHVIDSYKNNVIFSSILALSSLIYSGIFLKIFADTFNASAVNAFKNNIEIPEGFKNIESL